LSTCAATTPLRRGEGTWTAPAYSLLRLARDATANSRRERRLDKVEGYVLLHGAATERVAGRRRWQGSPCEGSGRRLARLDTHSTAVSGFFLNTRTDGTF
jgi:hypothetical protein